MAEKVDLYNSSYGKYELDVYRKVRLETYGEDFGQTSWVTTEESREIPKLLEMTADSRVLEIGCGSGRYALHLAEQTGCEIAGLDINTHGIDNARRLAQEAGLNHAKFQKCDVSKGLPFSDNSFDAIFANDVLCHIRGRSAIFAEIGRVLKPMARFLFSDALVIGGIVSDQEIAARSSIGYYEFSPPGENERLLRDAGFEILSVTESSVAAAEIAKRRHDSREKYKTELAAAEGEFNYQGQQRFLWCVHQLSSEKRLLRFVYLSRKTEQSP
jgi:ubiquinone/menaquinone biosynthesis C-methylase UbiE